MQSSGLNYCQYYPQQQNPNAVAINIYTPQAYADGSMQATNPIAQYPASGNFYPVYGPNQYPNLPLYPVNYNNNVCIGAPPNQGNTAAGGNGSDTGKPSSLNNNNNDDNTAKKSTELSQIVDTLKEIKNKDTKEKRITPLTDDYVKSIENYLNNPNPKIRLIGTKELLNRLKEDEKRKDNPSLIPLVNKILQDSSSSVRFLGLTMLQLDYCVGNDETIEILKQIQSRNGDKVGEEQLLASEVLLKMSAPNKVKIEREEIK